MVYTERAETAAVSRGTSHATTRYRRIFKNALKNASHSRRITCQRNESARERGIALYKSDQQQQQQQQQQLIVWPTSMLQLSQEPSFDQQLYLDLQIIAFADYFVQPLVEQMS